MTEERKAEGMEEKIPLPPLPERWCVQCEHKLDRHEVYEPFTSSPVSRYPGGGARVLFIYWSCKHCKLMYME